MKIKLKQATLVDCTNTSVTVVLLIQKKDKSIIEIEHTEKKKTKEPIDHLFCDYWHSIKVDDDVYDMNIWDAEDNGLIKVALYATKMDEDNKFLETITDKWTSTKLKMIPRAEYNICKEGLIKKQF